MTITPSMTTTPAPDAERKPLYAVAGAADAAVAALRELPTRVSEVANDEELRTELRNRFRELPAEVKAFRDGFPDFLLQAQARASDLPLRVRELVAQASREASKAYDEWAVRGESVVERLRGEYGPTVDDAVATVRGRVADAADDIAEITEKAADDLSAKR